MGIQVPPFDWRTPPDIVCERAASNGEARVWVRLALPDQPALRTPLPHVVRHSPTGMEWGYGGSGPSDLALSIMVQFVGQRLAEQGGLYMEFRRHFIEPLPPEGATIAGTAIVRWLLDVAQIPSPAEGSVMELKMHLPFYSTSDGWAVGYQSICHSHGLSVIIAASPEMQKYMVAPGADLTGVTPSPYHPMELAQCLIDSFTRAVDTLLGVQAQAIPVARLPGDPPPERRM